MALQCTYRWDKLHYRFSGSCRLLLFGFRGWRCWLSRWLKQSRGKVIHAHAGFKPINNTVGKWTLLSKKVLRNDASLDAVYYGASGIIARDRSCNWVCFFWILVQSVSFCCDLQGCLKVHGWCWRHDKVTPSSQISTQSKNTIMYST